MNAAFGAVSAGGAGTPLSDVTQSGGGPKALVPNQPGGNAGGVMPSKFSLNTTDWEQGPWHKGVGVGVVPAAELSTQPEAPSTSEADRTRVIAWEESIKPRATMTTAMNKATQSTFRNRRSLNERIGVSM